MLILEGKNGYNNILKMNIKKTAEFIGKQSKILLLTFGLVLVVLVGIVDYLTGYHVSFSVFYLFPIILVVWFSKYKLIGVFISVFSAIIWMLAEIMARPNMTIDLPILYWNTGIRLSFFLIITYLLLSLKMALARGQELAYTDYLTKVANSRFFYELADRELNMASRYKRVFTVAYIDIDNFKEINDKFGHKKGDFVLSLIASLIQSSVRKNDTVARIGGDEFIILAPETGCEQASEVFRRVQNNLIKSMKNQGYYVTISTGVVTYLTPPASVDEMIRLADVQMYSSKKDGKNMIRHEIFKGK